MANHDVWAVIVAETFRVSLSSRSAQAPKLQTIPSSADMINMDQMGFGFKRPVKAATKKSKSQPENAVKNGILQWLAIQGRQGRCFAWPVKSIGVWDQRLGFYRRDNSPFAIRGLPDIHGLWKKRDGTLLPIYIECKYGRGITSPDQDAFIDRVRRMGALALVCYSVQEAIDQLDPL